jgi:PHP domain
MPDTIIHGTFHFHSTYSHDGKNTLPEIAASLSRSGFSFCLMTEHFEDFDAEKFDRYVREAKEVSERTGFLLIPGVEVDLSGLHTIVFPARSFAEITRLASESRDGTGRMFKVLAHPSKYSFEKVARHVEKYKIDGLELWNQQADGRYTPPLDFLKQLKGQTWRNECRGFFGCDIHNVKMAPTNRISIAAGRDRTAETVMNALIEGDFVSRNDSTGIEYRNGSDKTNFDTWLETVQGKRNYRGKILGSVRSCLKPLYRMLPRDVRHSLNDVKNFVRDKV